MQVLFPHIGLPIAVFPKIMGLFPPNHPILIGFSIINIINHPFRGFHTPYFWFNTHGVSSSEPATPHHRLQVRHHCEIRGRGHGGIRFIGRGVKGWMNPTLFTGL